MKIGYFSPSYKRPQKSITQIKYPFVKLIVKQSEAKEYLENKNDIITCPDDAQGNIAKIRNYILDKYLKDFDAIVIIDDDCNGIGYWEKQKYNVLNEIDLQEFFESMYILTKEFDFKLFGFNCVMDKGAYREHTPFSTTKFIGAPCSMILKGNECRYDEEIPLKEDYDFTLQNLKKYKGVLRANFASYDVYKFEPCRDIKRRVAKNVKNYKVFHSWTNSDFFSNSKTLRRLINNNNVK
jgi:hypothetical protein